MDRRTAWDLYGQEQDLLKGWLCMTSANRELSTPSQWWLVRQGGVNSTSWDEEGGPEGGPCLLLLPLEGGASWLSEGIPVQGGKRYLFQFSMKREGERHWAHACAVNWVSLVFENDEGVPCREDPEWDQPLVQVRCRNTQGWVRATRCLVSPLSASCLRIGFRIDRGEPAMDDVYGFRRFWHGSIDTGKWWIGGVKLEEAQIQVGPSRGGLLIHKPKGGMRMRLVGPEGALHSPKDAICYEDGGGCFHLLGDRGELELAPGSYELQGMRGFRRTLYSEKIEVREGELSRARPEVQEMEYWRGDTWREGDHHNHLSFHGSTRYPLMTMDDVFQIARAEGLDFLSFCAEIVDQHAYADWRDRGAPPMARPDGTLTSEDFVSVVSHEVTQDLLGHVCVVNGPGHLEPGHPWWLAPTNAEISRRIREKDPHGTVGALVLAHPYHGMTSETVWDVLPSAEKTCLQREMPVDIALGWADTMDFLSVEEPEDLQIRFRDYFRFLNLGLSIGVSGASDVYADQGTEIVGSLRTVVEAGGLDMNEIAQGYRSRRTMATNGPVVRFTVNGKGPGERLQGSPVDMECVAFSNWGLSRLEVVSGGEVVADASPGDDGWIRLEKELELDRSSWLVVRVWGPGHPALNMRSLPEEEREEVGQWCITSPVWVDVPNRPLLPSASDAEYFIRWIDASCEAIRNRVNVLRNKGPNGPQLQDDDVDEALRLFNEGRKVYEEILALASG